MQVHVYIYIYVCVHITGSSCHLLFLMWFGRATGASLRPEQDQPSEEGKGGLRGFNLRISPEDSEG